MEFFLNEFFYTLINKGRFPKKVWNFPHFSGVGWFEKIIKIFQRSKWQLDLPDLEIWTSTMGKNNFLPKCLFLLKNDFKTMLFLFFSTLCEWGVWVLKSVENSTIHTFF